MGIFDRLFGKKRKTEELPEDESKANRATSSVEDLKRKKDSTRCAKCGRKVVDGLKAYINTIDFYYGPSDKESAWPRKMIVGKVFGEEVIPPDDAELFGGICSKCGKTYCIICMHEEHTRRLVNIPMDPGTIGAGALLDKKGQLWCPKCRGSTRTVNAT